MPCADDSRVVLVLKRGASKVNDLQIIATRYPHRLPAPEIHLVKNHASLPALKLLFRPSFTPISPRQRSSLLESNHLSVNSQLYCIRGNSCGTLLLKFFLMMGICLTLLVCLLHLNTCLKRFKTSLCTLFSENTSMTLHLPLQSLRV